MDITEKLNKSKMKYLSKRDKIVIAVCLYLILLTIVLTNIKL